ncbi:MAG: Maf family protein, partial [candidate division WOR-3 bacterium]
NRKEARAMIQRLSGRKHKVLSAVFLIDSKTGRQWQAIEKTAVKFRRLGPAEIESYIRSSEPYDKAGGYAIQGQAGLFVEWIDGCYWNVVGFPISSFLSLLKKSGYF